eukprot:maker-scaffold856_size87843-snap-gene-0.23 protein:Tk08374 transcript:maker-scaffold856_size87843-snap-gene-0.23-mRNA-1 annotation:"general transcription factor 3c polypeptide 3"
MTDDSIADFNLAQIALEDLTEDTLMGVAEAEPEAGPSQPTASTSRHNRDEDVLAVPSGSGLTFLMSGSPDELDFTPREDDEDEDDPRRILEQSQDSSLGATDNPEDDEMNQAQRERELTDKYLTGRLSFRDFVKEMSLESDDEEAIEEEELEESASDTSDAEWTPSKKTLRTEASAKKVKELDPEDHQGHFESEMDQTQRQQLSRKGRKLGSKNIRRKRLDPALQGLMGEANLRFVRGDKETAIRMCMEVIRQDPTAPEPYQTLSNVYEEGGEQDKALQFALIAAHLAPQDPEEWARLADMSLEMGDRPQAISCYRKAIDADLENSRYHLVRCTLLEQGGEMRSAIRGYKRLLAVLRADQGEDFIHASKELARLLHEKENFEGAKDAIYEAVKRYPQGVASEELNLLLELLISLAQNDEALEVLCKYCSTQFSSETAQEELDEMNPEQQLKAFTAVILPEDTPLDIKAKLIIVLVNLTAHHLVQPYCQDIVASEPEEYGELYLDIAEVFMSNALFQESLVFLKKLVDSESYNQPAVWLKYGESLFETNSLEEAEIAYKKVVDTAPQHHEARRTLSSILHKLGRPDEALCTLTQDEDVDLLNPTLLYEKCQLLWSEGCFEEFVRKANLFFSRHFVKIRNREELHAIASAKKLASKNKALSEVRAYRREPLIEDGGPSFEDGWLVSLEDEYQLFRKLCDYLFEQKSFGALQKVSFSAMGSPYFNKKPEIMKECEFLCLISSFLNGDSYHAYNLVRELVTKHIKNPRIWNLFNLVIMRADDIRHNRFLMRLMSRNPDNIALGILNGHNCLVAGTYKYSLGEYMSAFKQERDNPMVALMLGLTFTHMACQKFSAKKHSLVVQSCAFLHKYLQLRGPCQESYYNLGRAMHQLGLLPAALFYYKKALALPPPVEEDPKFDLRKETAFNVSLIYRNSGSFDLAAMYLQKYINRDSPDRRGPLFLRHHQPQNHCQLKGFSLRDSPFGPMDRSARLLLEERGEAGREAVPFQSSVGTDRT